MRPEDLVAITRPLAAAPDLIEIGAARGGVLWTSDEIGLAGRGVALRLAYQGPGTTEATTDALEAIESHHEMDAAGPGLGPIAFAALPFHPDAPGELIVPRRIVGRRGSQMWETTVEPRSSAPEVPAPTTPELSDGELSPDEFALTPSMPHDEWMQIIADAVARIRVGELAKVVLARRVDVVANRAFRLGEVLTRLTALYPACMIFHVDGFVGASPELLVRRQGRSLASHPLAGTVARSGDLAADQALVAGLLASSKERWEHRVVIDHLAETLAPWCENLEIPTEPIVLGLRNVSHLATPIAGTLTTRHGRIPTALDLVAAIHPTAAVGGHPSGDALAYLDKVEGFDRGAYAGPVGWVDARGDGAWALGIRSARIDGPRASMFAGVGIVADSDPAAELAETQLKLQALLAALVRP